MAHNILHTGAQWLGGVASNVFNDSNLGLINALGAAGQIASTESAISRLQDIGAEGKAAIGMPAGSIYDTVAGASQFKPFSVYSLPGSVTTTAAGGTTFDLSPEQRALEQSLRTRGSALIGDVTFGLSPEQTALEQTLRTRGSSLVDDVTFGLSPDQTALEQSLRTGGSTLIDALLGRGQYGTLDPTTGQYRQNLRAGQSELMRVLEGGSLIDPLTGQHEQTYRSRKQADYLKRFRDPFTAGELATSEQTLFDRLREIRMPEEERARVALQQQLVAGGRQGLQTAQFGGSPESFALNKAIEEQTSQDVISAMNFARQDAQLLADANLRAVQEGRTDQSLQSQQRLAAFQQQVQEKQLTGNLAEQLLASSYRPSQARLAQTQLTGNLAEQMLAGSYRPSEARLAQTQLTGNLAEQMLASSYRPTQALTAQMQPSLNLADIATVAGRQLGGYGSELGRAALDYDLGSEGAAANLRNQLLQGLFGMLTQSGQQQPPTVINVGSSGGSGASTGGFGW